MTNAEKKVILKDALDDLIRVFVSFQKAYDNMCEWYNAYGECGRWRSSDMQFEHDLDYEGIGFFSASDIWAAVYNVIKKDNQNESEWPYEFAPNYSFDEIPNSVSWVNGHYDEIIDDLNKKFANDIEQNSRFMNLDLDD